MQMTNALAYNNDDIYINTLETSVTQDRNSRFERGRLPNRRRQSPLLNLAITHQMAPPRQISDYCVATHLSTPKG